MNSGDPCPKNCGGRLHVYSTRNGGDFQIRYLCCASCKTKPSDNKVIERAASVRRRKFA